MCAQIKRWSLRLLGVGVLVAVGCVAFHTAKTWPRSVIVSDTHILDFADDGGTILTGYTGMQIGSMIQGGEGKPPLKVWDTRSGEVILTLLDDVKGLGDLAICRTHGRLAIDLAGCPGRTG
jgi:hypothetical protein